MLDALRSLMCMAEFYSEHVWGAVGKAMMAFDLVGHTQTLRRAYSRLHMNQNHVWYPRFISTNLPHQKFPAEWLQAHPPHMGAHITTPDFLGAISANAERECGRRVLEVRPGCPCGDACA